MRLIKGGNTSPEYWKLWLKGITDKSETTVNGIPASDPDFIDKVLISISETGAVYVNSIIKE